MPTDKKRRELTDFEKRDAKLLKDAWNAAKRRRRGIQARAFAAAENVHESAISQYMNGVVALNVEWKMRFARYLDVVPQKIWPNWEFASLTPGDIPPSAVQLARAWSLMSAEQRRAVEAVVNAMDVQRLA